MMKFKKVWLVIASLTVALSLFPSAAFALPYDGASPITSGCSADAVVKASKRLSNGKGTVELRYSPSCKTAWARITMDSAATYNWAANAVIQREHDSKTYACQDPGGNGVVNSGQRSCYTPMVYDGPGYRAVASGGHFNSSGAFIGTATTAYY
ncbi:MULTISPECIES: DUF2690 domain-containing protein [unclassified Paenibacillus]|uniref:DUF2690 domain-containing protein n=1 Tax=unclassified Paenibacillus TaxID=185978 RepID=UPI0036D3F03E